MTLDLKNINNFKLLIRDKSLNSVYKISFVNNQEGEIYEVEVVDLTPISYCVRFQFNLPTEMKEGIYTYFIKNNKEDLVKKGNAYYTNFSPNEILNNETNRKNKVYER